jgi:hypothetical protein
MSNTQVFFAFLVGGMLATIYIARSLPGTVKRYLELKGEVEAALAEHQQLLTEERAYVEAMQQLLVIALALRVITGPPRRISERVPPAWHCPDCGSIQPARPG